MKLRSVLMSIGFAGALAVPFILALPTLAQLVTNIPASEVSFKRGILDSVNENLLAVQLSDGSSSVGIVGIVLNASTKIVPKFKELGTNILTWPRGLVLNVVGLPKWQDSKLGVTAKSVEVDTKNFFLKKYMGSAENVKPTEGMMMVASREGSGYRFDGVTQEGTGGNPVRFVRVNGRQEEPISLSDIHNGDPVELVELWYRASRTSNNKITELMVRVFPRTEKNVVRVLPLNQPPWYSRITVNSANRVAIQNNYNTKMYVFAKVGQEPRFIPSAGRDQFLGEMRSGSVSRQWRVTTGEPVSILVYNARNPVAGTAPVAEFIVEVQP